MAQGWLTHAEPFSRPRHAAVLHDRLEHDEQVEVEGSPISSETSPRDDDEFVAL